MDEHQVRHEHIARELARWLIDDEGELPRVIRLVQLFPAASIHDLLRLADDLGYPDAEARLEAAILYRLREGNTSEPFERVIRAARYARDHTRAEVFVTLAPLAGPRELDVFIDQAATIGDSRERGAALEVLQGLRDLRVELDAQPDAAAAEWEPPTLTPRHPSDTRLLQVLERLDETAREAVLTNALGRAMSEAQPPMAAAEPEPPVPEPAAHAPEQPLPAPSPDWEPELAGDGAEPDAQAEREFPASVDAEPPPAGRVSHPSAAPPPASPPPPSFGRPSLGGPLRSVGNALRNIGGAVRDAIGGLATSSSPVLGGDRDAPRQQAVVNTGIATSAKPGETLNPDVSLAAGREHLFWLDIGAPARDSIEVTPTGPDPELVRMEAELTVVLFNAPGSKAVVRGATRGRLRLQPDGSAVVLEQPGKDPPKGLEPGLAERRLFFPIETPAGDTTISFRCNLYHRNVLVQSRLVRCLVQAQPERREGALRSTLDYVLARTLDPANLEAAGPQQLSIMANEVGGTHAFYFAGGKDAEWAEMAEFDGHELQSLLRPARGALRMAAWGTEDAWNGNVDEYLYRGPGDVDQLTTDILQIANRGYAAYFAVIGRLAGGGADRMQRSVKLTEDMRQPGSVQIAVHDNPRFLLPASLLYDYPYDTGEDPEAMSMCSTFLENLPAAAAIDDPIERAGKLAGTDCFMGKCPNATVDDTIVCPGGLWGYRHTIGIPVSLETKIEWAKHATRPWKPIEGGDPPSTIDVKDRLQFGVSISTVGLKGWQAHEEGLRGLSERLQWHFADTRDLTFDMLKTSSPHVVYFYCHGGVEGERPFIQVGPDKKRVIFGDNLLNKGVVWKGPRPLVFINGCHTTNVEPEIAHNLVSAFVATSRASGVIGTEITIFEPLAREFAETFFMAFFAGQTIGEAVRTARLALLARSNPLGLVYNAYALSSLRLTGLKN